MVYAETELDRMERIALAEDEWIVKTVRRWKNECDSFLEGGPAVLGSSPSGMYEFTEDDCEDIIIAVYDAGFTEPVNGDHLTGFEAIDKPDERYDGRFSTGGKKKGSITINIGRIENEYTFEGEGGRPSWEEVTRETVAHERIHLADWADDSEFDWIVSQEDHHSAGGHYDQTSRWGRFIGEQADPVAPELDWSRRCLDDQVSYFLSGWGHHTKVRAGYCLVRMVLQGGR